MRAFRMSVVAVIALSAVPAGVASAWVRPEIPSTQAPANGPSARLDFVLVEVNGEPRVIRDGEELQVVTGDRVTIKDGQLRDAAGKIREINVVGFQSARGSEDRGATIDTAKDLKAKWSEGGKGSVYAVVASSKATLHGAVYLNLVAPTLRYAEISVNGQKRILRDGELVKVKGADAVKVERVVTNLQSHDGVLFQMAEVDPAQGDYEIRFTRGELVFATIPLKVKE